MVFRIIKTITLLGIGALAAFASGARSLAVIPNPTPLSISDEVNRNPSSSWVAEENRLTALSREEILPLMGTQVDQSNIFRTDLYRFRESSDIECSLCQAALGWVEKEVAGNASVTRIEEALDEVCNLAPGSSLKTFCRTIVDTYTPELVNYIMSKESPQVICQKLGICQSAMDLVREYDDKLECVLCHYVLGWMEKFLQSDRSIARIEEGLDVVCEKIPSRYRARCTQVVQTYTPELINFILSRETPEVVCHQLRLCEQDEQAEVRESSLPDNFDGRVAFGSCVHPVRDQGKCGSCWAVSASEVLSDRFCIFSKKATDVILSPENLVECDLANHGCQGGMLNTAWDFMVRNGLVSEACMPYTSGAGVASTCPKACADGSDIHKVYKAASSRHVWSVMNLVQGIQTELMNGPVQAAFEVYQDFMAYKTGVYHHVAGSLLGGHAVELVGWGVENSQPYWLAKNSWGTAWGISGYFKILRGKNECGIESNIYAGSPQL